MSQFHLFPEGLKARDYERGRPRGPPPLAFLPAREEKNEALAEKKSVKIKVSDTLTETVTEFDSGPPEAYIRNIDIYEGLKRRMGLVADWSALTEVQKGLDEDLSLHLLEKPTPDEENQAVAGTPPPQQGSPERSGGEANSNNAGSAASGGSTTTVITKLQAWESKKTELENQIDTGKVTLAWYLTKAFDTFERLLSEPARDRWQTIVVKITARKPWTDEKGVVHKDKEMGQSWLSLRLCQREFLLEVFQKDAAEKQRNYIQHQLKKPGEMCLRNWVARLRYLARAIRYLPCLADSKEAPPRIKRNNRELTEYKLCSVIMQAIKQK